MRRTKHIILLDICLLVCCLLLYFYNDFENILSSIDKLIDKFTNKEVIIPKIKNNYRNYNYKTVHETDDFVPNSYEEIQNIYYTVLNNGWDNFTFYCPSKYKSCINDVKQIGNDFDYISILNNYVSPYNSYRKYNTEIRGNDKVELSINKLYSLTETVSLMQKIKGTIKDLKINKNNSTLNDLRNIHNFIIKNTTYDEKFESNNALSTSSKASGTYIDGKAICSGYTDLFALFLDELNIPNFKITSENHVWNVVYFSGRWNHIDVTWDDDDSYYDNYSYFLITTKDLLNKDSKEHNFNKAFYKEL